LCFTFDGKVLHFPVFVDFFYKDKRGNAENMRLDKYLKVTRLIKRRTVANEACDAGKITVNGKIARASYDVKADDIIEINMGVRPIKVKVLKVTEYATKESASDNYIVIE